MPLSKKSSFQKHKIKDSPIYSVTVRIVAMDKDFQNVVASGTGVVVAQNLVLTAKHVFEDFAVKFGIGKINSAGVAETDDFNIWVMFMSNHPGQLYHVYEVAQIHLNPYSDLALFHLNSFDKAGKNHRYFSSPLSLVIPSIGERVTAFGYPKSKVVVRRDEQGTSHIEINDEPSISVGEIKDVHPEKRDNFSITFPSALTNARMDGGMSGGPVFNDEGMLIGLVCRGYDLVDDEEPISYIALLWPLMATIVELKGERIPLYKLAEDGIVKTEGLEHIIIDDREVENRYAISYNREVTAVKKLDLPPIGRNDPCPCGSGKKYKKCCSP
ncbi:MAG TPA: trypsin-like peptidase domain-containing protein [Chryseolinea sp.]|nr:trypsin-like peptidase domain-containing protein [Chryseolinea sp.]